MPNPKRTETATEADWSFCTPDVVDMLHKVARQGARSYDLLDEGDLFSELCLYLAVRPERHGSIKDLKSTALWYIRDLARNARIRAERDIPSGDMRNPIGDDE